MKRSFINRCILFIGLDGCHSKGSYGGVLPFVIALDVNNGLFSIAIEVVKSENKECWTFFVQWLKTILGMNSLNMHWVLMIDGHKI